MRGIPDSVLDALSFRDPRPEALWTLSDVQWLALLTHWETARLTLLLRQTCGDAVPDWVKSRVDVHLSDTALRFERIKTDYSDVANALTCAEAEFVVVKGFTLWPGYVEHPRFRPQSDIDLYSPPESILRARDALSALGYEPSEVGEHHPKDHLPAMVPKTQWEWRGNLFDPEIPVSFELHSCFWNETIMRFWPNGLDQFWSRRCERQLDGISFPALNPVDNLAFTSLNVLRDLLRGSPTAEQVYGLARFLHTNANDQRFWTEWRELHDDSLRRLEAISFRLAIDWFDCRVPESVQEEINRLPTAVQIWFQDFANSLRNPRFPNNKDGMWLHLALLESFTDKVSVLARRLVSFPTKIPTFASLNIRDSSTGAMSGALHLLRGTVKYLGWFLTRVIYQLNLLPVTLGRGIRYWLSTKTISRQFWTFLAASFCFDLGMTIFFFLYNLYLLDRGIKEDFLGLITSVMGVGSIAGTIPAGMLVQRLGLRRSLLVCFASVALVSAARALFVSHSALLVVAFLGGLVTTIWAVAISPAIANLTNEQSRPFGFSMVFSFGIGIGTVASQAAGRLPGLLKHFAHLTADVHAKQLALLVGCAIVLLGLVPLSRLKFRESVVAEKRLYPRSPFLWRFLPALAVWSLVTGAFSPFANVYFSQHLRMPLEKIGVVFSLAQLVQVLAVLAAPLVFRKFGLVIGIVYTQIATAIALTALAVASGAAAVSVIYIGYTGLLWMSEPGMFSLLMDQVAPGERAGASALNFLVISLAQTVSVAVAGASLSRFGYPSVLVAITGVALVAALSFWSLLGKNFRLQSAPASLDS
jgi:MFS family permease